MGIQIVVFLILKGYVNEYVMTDEIFPLDKA
jgi:hypothetical protein